MHGTGTPLGDPVEFGALAGKFCSSVDSLSDSRPPITLLASKSSFGHSEPASGLVGLLQVKNCRNILTVIYFFQYLVLCLRVKKLTVKNYLH